MKAQTHILAWLLLAILPAAGLWAQTPVEPCLRWLATVDEPTQQIVLSWSPSATPQTLGYHICTGNPCIDYDTVFGRLDTTYVCTGHTPLEPHAYRLHVFDSAYNVSALTPPFGNMVLTADVPVCAAEVTTAWTPCNAMPDSVAQYTLWGLCEPQDSAYTLLFTTADNLALHHAFELPDRATAVRLKVQAEGGSGRVSQSNVVRVERRTADTARTARLASVCYDSASAIVRVALVVDTGFACTLQRSADGGPWTEVAAVHPSQPEVTVDDYSPESTRLCYRLEVFDACGLNPRHSDTLCLDLPRMGAMLYAPNVLLPGDPDRGNFCPRLRGMLVDNYELYVYSRQGLTVFHTEDPAACWTPDPALPQGTYVFSLHCRMAGGEARHYSGSITLIK